MRTVLAYWILDVSGTENNSSYRATNLQCTIPCLIYVAHG